MLRIHAIRGLLMLTALVLSVAGAKAATFDVNQTSGPYFDIQSALDAATTGSTVLITDSATYTTGTLRLERSLKIMAAVGQTPTIVDDRNDADGGVMFDIDSANAAAVDGFQLGSLEGGRINLVFDTTATSHTGPGTGGPNTRNYVFPRMTGGWDDLTSFTLENLHLTQTKGDPDNTFRMHLVRDDGGATRTVTVNHVEVDDGNFEGGGDPTLRIDNSFAYYTVSNSYFHNYGGNWVFYGRSGATFNIVNTAVDTTNSSVQAVTSFTDSAGRINTYNIDDSLFLGGSGGIFERSSSGGNWNFNNSVFVGFGDSILEDTSSNETDILVADHCDFVLFSDGDDAIIDLNDSGSSRDVSIRNSNVLLFADWTTGTTPLLNIVPDTGDTIVLEYNNVASIIPGWEGGLYAAGLTPSNSLSLDPFYSNIQIGDARYGNTTVKTGDEFGGPIGNDTAFNSLVPVELSVFEVM